VKLATLVSMARTGDLQLHLRIQRVLNPVYRAFFLSGAASHGVLARLARGPVSFEALAADVAPAPDAHRRLSAWLRVGLALGELRLGPDGYDLRGKLAKQLADPANDAFAALLEEAVTLDRELLIGTPSRLASDQELTLADQQKYGRMVARSSRVLEPYVFEALAGVVPAEGEFRILDVGCGAGGYLRFCAARNTQSTAIGLELQSDVAALAQDNVRKWRLEERVSIETGDIRTRAIEPLFDLITLHNNIYYFPVEDRVDLLARLRGSLKANGRVLITTACQDGQPAIEILNLWAESTKGCGPLPKVTEMVSQLRSAGFTAVHSKRLTPGYNYRSFTGKNESTSRSGCPS
jgi:SAM-dependent methyltransferase